MKSDARIVLERNVARMQHLQKLDEMARSVGMSDFAALQAAVTLGSYSPSMALAHKVDREIMALSR